MTTDSADRNEPLRKSSLSGHRDWLHRACKHFQLVPIEGGEIQCEKCLEWVHLTPKKPINDKSISKSRKSKKHVQSTFSTEGGIKIVPHNDSTKYDTHRIHGRNKLTKFISPGNTFRSVGYDWSINLILELLKNNMYKKSTIIVGLQLTSNSDYSTIIAELYEFIADGRLEIRVPKKGTWHEKFFIVEGVDDHGVPFYLDINGSSNPTQTGTGKKGNQSNRITESKFVGEKNISENEFVVKLESMWNDYISKSELFEGDLMDLLNVSPKEEWVKTIKKYYDGDIVSTGEGERTPVELLRTKVGGELLRESQNGKKVVKLSLGDFSSETIDEFMTDIGTLGFSAPPSIDGEIEIPISLLDSTKYSTDSLPFMQILDGSVYLRSQGVTYCRTKHILDSNEINSELEKIENYVNTVENSHSPGLKSKMAISEFIMAGLCSPFDHLWMDLRKSRFNRVAEGPQMTSYAGTSGNGKSYASRYILKMLTGLDLEPLPSTLFTETKVCGAAKSGNIMPLVFDDLKRDRIREWDKWGKFVWDKGHAVGEPFAQTLVTANDPIDSRGPLGRRVREIWMDATFQNNGTNTAIVENCLAKTSELFPYFSGIVLNKYFHNDAPYEHLDPLKIGRNVLSEIYKVADRKQPRWWCNAPYKECVDTNAYLWFDILNKSLFETKWKGDSFVIYIEENPHEINERLKGFPGYLKAKKAGQSIVIGNAKEFIIWLKSVELLYSEDNSKPCRKMRKLLRTRL